MLLFCILVDDDARNVDSILVVVEKQEGLPPVLNDRRSEESSSPGSRRIAPLLGGRTMTGTYILFPKDRRLPTKIPIQAVVVVNSLACFMAGKYSTTMLRNHALGIGHPTTDMKQPPRLLRFGSAT